MRKNGNEFILTTLYARKVYLKENLSQTNLSQIQLLKKSLQMVLRSSQGTNLKIPTYNLYTVTYTCKIE